MTALGSVSPELAAEAGAAAERALRDESWLVRAEAVECLAKLGCTEAWPSVLWMLEAETNVTALASAAEAAGQLGIHEALPRLLHLLAHTDTAVRAYAAGSVGLLGRPDHLPALREALNHESSGQGVPALLVASIRLEDDGALTRLLSLVDDPDDEVARAAFQEIDFLIRCNRPPSIGPDEMAAIGSAVSESIAKHPRPSAEGPALLELLNRDRAAVGTEPDTAE